ncbi:hypothetical protein EMCG_05822 [[Emmonsia] crescens]|uniref:Uncharacterized protein n=1 Tax=[Emmonsia] crescens TaxID=73230 RepID=A0A0G2JC34_9EURO|nr:hypothetical protein EMCG_05822 [Emmonsia crescens UAMH 3008]
MAGKKMVENPPTNSIGQNTDVKQGPASSANPTQGRINSPRLNENTAPKNKSTKQEATSGKENQDVPALRTNEQASARNTLIGKGATNSRESQLDDLPKPASKAQNQSNGAGKEYVPPSSVEGSTVGRTTTPPPKRPAALGTQSTGREKPSDKIASTSKNGRPPTPNPAPSSRNGDKTKGKAKEQDPQSRSEIANMFAKSCPRAATDRHGPLSSRQPSPSRSTTERKTQSASSSRLVGRRSNNVMEDAIPASSESTKKKKRTRRAKRKKKTSTIDHESAADGSSSESDKSSPTKQPALSETATGKRPMAVTEASVKPAAVIRIVRTDTKGKSSKGNGASSRAPSPVNGDGSKPITIDDVYNVKATAPKNGQPARGDQSPRNSGGEEIFAALGSGQGPSFAKVVNKGNRTRPSKAEKRLKRLASAKADSPTFENRLETFERPGSEDGMNEHSMISIADIPSDDELGIEKIEEIFGRNDVPDSSKLECIKAIMIKQNQIIARKTQLVNNYLKENEELQERVEEFDSSILTQEDDKDEQQGQIDKLKVVVDEFQRQMQSQESFIKIAERDKSRLEEELKSSTISLKITEKDRKAFKESVSKMATDMVQMKSDIDQLLGEKNGYLATISKYESERDMLLCQLHHGPTQLENARLESELLEKGTELAVANQNLKDLQREFTTLRKREKKEQGKRTPSALSTELWLLGAGKEEEEEEKGEEWEPSIDQSGVERNPFAPLSSPVMTPSLFQFGGPTSFGNGGEKYETNSQIPKTFLRQAEEVTKDSGSLACLNAGVQTEIPADTSSSTQKNKVEVLEVSTQIPAQAHVQLGIHSSTQTSVVDMMEASAQTIRGAGVHEFEMLEASTQTEEDARVKVKMLEVSTQTMVGIDISASTQTGKVDVLEASAQTDTAASVREMRDVLVQTEPVTVLAGSGLRRGIRLALMMLAWAVVILWGYKEDQQLWLDANGVSRAALVGIRDTSLGPFPWFEQLRFDLVVWLQVDRVLPG